MNSHFTRRRFLVTTAGELSFTDVSPALAADSRPEASTMLLCPLGRTSRIWSIGWTDLMLGERTPGCTWVDWIEVYGYPVNLLSKRYKRPSISPW
jgi:hypothetical protein